MGENPVKGVIREVREEAGYAFKPSGVLGIYSSVMKSLASYFKSTPHAVIIVFLGKISGKQGKFIEDEISETGWFSAKEIKNMDKKTLTILAACIILIFAFLLHNYVFSIYETRNKRWQNN